MEQASGYSFDPMTTRGRSRSTRHGIGATTVVGTTQKTVCSNGSGGSRHNTSSAPRVSGVSYGYEQHKTSDKANCFSNISQITVNKDKKGSQENGDGVRFKIEDELLKEESGEAKKEQDSDQGNNATCTSDSGISLSAQSPSDAVTTSESVTKLPSTNSSASSSTATLGGSTKASSYLPTLNLNLNLPPLAQTITHGFGVKMVATSSSQQLIYRSVPPRPLSYTLTDVLDSTGPLGSKLRSKTAPVSTNTPEEYAQRFKSRPTTRPKVIEFDGSVVSSKYQRATSVTPGFPLARAKIYIGRPKSKSPESAEQMATRSSGSRLHLQPLGSGTSRHQQMSSSATPGPFTSRTQRSDRQPLMSGGNQSQGNANNYTQYTPSRTLTKSAASSVLGHPTRSSTSTGKVTDILRETSQSIDFTTSIPQDLPSDPDDHIHNPELLLTSSTDCDDLSILPPPKKVLPKRELPWVFRYKVKRGMNALSKIMASRPPPCNMLHSSHTFT